MGQLNLNLSTQPFKPYRAANLGLLLILLVLLATSAVQVYSYRDYSGRSAAIRAEEQEAKAKAESLTRDIVAMNKRMTGGGAAAKLSEVEFLNGLILKKGFSWTWLFARLEELLPDDVYLLGVRPFSDDDGSMGINMAIRAHSLADAATFVRLLEGAGVFGEVTVAVEEKKDPLPEGEVEVTLGAHYYPDRSAP